MHRHLHGWLVRLPPLPVGGQVEVAMPSGPLLVLRLEQRALECLTQPRPDVVPADKGAAGSGISWNVNGDGPGIMGRFVRPRTAWPRRASSRRMVAVVRIPLPLVARSARSDPRYG